jgi:hypothetical protein
VRVALYANDHPPPHIHAIRRDRAWPRLALNCPDGPVTLIDQSGFRLVADLASICERWKVLHG